MERAKDKAREQDLGKAIIQPQMGTTPLPHNRTLEQLQLVHCLQRSQAKVEEISGIRRVLQKEKARAVARTRTKAKVQRHGNMS